MIDRAVETSIVAIFGAIVLVGAAQVFNRYVLNYSLSWSEEFQRYGQIWMVFLAIPVAYRRGLHMGIEGLRNILGDAGRRRLVCIIDVLWLVLGGSIAIGTIRFMSLLSTQRSPGMGLPMHWVYGGILLGSVYMLFISVRRIVAFVTGKPVLDGRGEA